MLKLQRKTNKFYFSRLLLTMIEALKIHQTIHQTSFLIFNITLKLLWWAYVHFGHGLRRRRILLWFTFKSEGFWKLWPHKSYYRYLVTRDTFIPVVKFSSWLHIFLNKLKFHSSNRFPKSVSFLRLTKLSKFMLENNSWICRHVSQIWKPFLILTRKLP